MLRPFFPLHIPHTHFSVGFQSFQTISRALHAWCPTYLTDGDNARQGVISDLGFAVSDRAENIRRVGEVAKLMVDADVVVLTAFISPFQAERDMVRGLFEEGEFFEIFVDTPLEVAELRDPKVLYKKARSGSMPNFMGIGRSIRGSIDARVSCQNHRTVC